MVLALSMAITLGVGGTSTTGEAATIPDSPAAALSLEQIGPESPAYDPWLEVESESFIHPDPVPGSEGERTPEQLFAALTLILVLAGAMASRRDTARDAVATVRSHLRDNIFSDVTHGDLVAIEAVINRLSPGERVLVLEALSDREVAVWMRELDGFNGSFSTAEEDRLFAGLVEGVDGEALARLAMEGKGPEVVAALTAHGTARQQVALASELAERAEGHSRIQRLIPELVERADASAWEAEVTEWIADGELGGRLDQFFGVWVDQHEKRGAGYILDAAAALARTGARFQDPAVKGALFVELVRRLAGAEGEPWEGSVADTLAGTTQLLRSDVAGVLSQLNHGLDPHGNILGRWVEEMINEDRIDELDVVLADLLGGSDRVSHFSDPGSDPADPYPNASNLGYFVGAYQLAIEEIADDAEEKVELVGTLFAVVTGVILGPRGGDLNLPLGPLVDIHAREVIGSFQGRASQVKQALWGLAKPRTEDGLLWNGPGTTQFQDAWEEVVEVR